MTYLQQWLDSPDGGGMFTAQRDQILAHGLDCPGLSDVWMPRRGGHSCPSDLIECDGCGITFFWEGIRVVDEDSCLYSNHFYCACCATTECGCTE